MINLALYSVIKKIKNLPLVEHGGVAPLFLPDCPYDRFGWEYGRAGFGEGAGAGLFHIACFEHQALKKVYQNRTVRTLKCIKTEHFYFAKKYN
jgi:hypothetical protein